MATIIETDLKEILSKIDNRLEHIEKDLTDFKADMAKELTDFKTDVSKDMTVLKVDMATIKTELTTIREDVKELKGSQRSQIWALIITVIGATITAVVKFGFFPNP